jgi:hypothetical protein
MKKVFARLGLLTMILSLASSVGLSQSAPNAAGHWQGKIEIPDHELNITVDIAKNAKGAWIGSISVVGSSSIDVPLSSIAVDGQTVRFTAALPEKASFEGHFSADANSLSGTASNAEGSVDFKLTRNGEANVKLPAASSALPKEFEGTWEGTITSDGKTRHIAVKLSASPDGTATAILIAVDKGNLEIPVSVVTITDKQLQLDVRAVSGKYAGRLGANGEITGEWSEGQNHLELNFKHAGPPK